MKRFLLAATILALPLAAKAQPVTGLYVGAGAGANFMPPEKVEGIFQSPPASGQSGFVTRTKVNFDTGFVGVGSVGYGFGNGLRVEAEGDYRYNSVSHTTTGGFSTSGFGNLRERKYGGMANVLFDFDIGSPYVFPYAGAGVGYMEVEHQDVNAGTFAYQGIAGVSLPIPWVVGLSATLEYRFQGL
ncbi:MAG TPA: outer membrane beta-barrel protein, partial [Acetobacteraceae bacterium]|nr:outer membrane beta-barrel protein [Acetobacteraceae bacterium]